MRSTRYPHYILSKGRFENCMTAKMFEKWDMDYTIVVERFEYEEYANRFGDKVVILPDEVAGSGSAIPARNYIWQLAEEAGAERHWCWDDNIYEVRRLHKTHRIPCDPLPACQALEDFTDRYENVAISGMNYVMFGLPFDRPPFFLNTRVYSCMLIRTDLPYRWRGTMNADTDLCLQVLSGGWCTVLVNAFLVDKARTMTKKGGNTEKYKDVDGRLKMARQLERRWPGVVEVRRRFQRPQHHIKNNWRGFDTPLKLKEGEPKVKEPSEYGMKCHEHRPVKSPRIRKMIDVPLDE